MVVRGERLTENEKKKEYLNSYKNLCKKIKSLECQLEELRESKSSAQAIVMDDMPKGTNQSDLSDYMVKVDELEAEIKKTRQECLDRKLEIEHCIVVVKDGVESAILHKRYIELKDWTVIAVEINYSWKHTHRLHSKALNKFKMEGERNE